VAEQSSFGVVLVFHFDAKLAPPKKLDSESGWLLAIVQCESSDGEGCPQVETATSLGWIRRTSLVARKPPTSSQLLNLPSCRTTWSLADGMSGTPVTMGTCAPIACGVHPEIFSFR
jgi:hypothetical protein